MSRNLQRILLIVWTVVALLAAAGSLIPATMSVMLFDAPDSTSNPAVWTLFLAVVTFPLSCIVGLIAAWVFFAKERGVWCVLAALLPLLNVAIAALAMLVLETSRGG